MAESEGDYVISVDLIPMFRSPGREAEHIEDMKSVMEIMKEVYLINQKFESEGCRYFRLKDVQAEDDLVLITLNCAVSSAQELKDLESAIRDQSLGKKLANYAAQCGLKVSLGLTDLEQLTFELEVTRTQLLRAGKFFEMQRKEVQSETASGNMQKQIISGSSASKTESISKQEDATMESEEGKQQLTSQQIEQQTPPLTSQHKAMQEKETDFYLCVPFPSQDIVDVHLLTNYNNRQFKMKKQSGLVWKKSLRLPANVQEIIYSFTVRLEQQRPWVFKIFGTKYEHKDEFNTVHAGTTVMDLFLGKNQPVGYIEHMKEILLRLRDQGLEESIVQTNWITERFHKFERVCNVSYIVEHVSKVKLDTEGMVLLAFMIGNLVSEFRMTGILNSRRDLCMQMLSSFSNITPEQFSEETLNLFQTAVLVIGQSIFPETGCLAFRFLEFCFGFLPIQFFSELFMEYIKTTEKYSINKKEDLQPVLKIIVDFGKRQKTKKKQTCEFLMQILRHSHLAQWIYLKDEVSELLSQREVEELLELKIHHECKQFKRKNDFGKFSQLCEMIEDCLTERTAVHVRRTFVDLIRTSSKQTEIDALQIQMILKIRKLYSSPKDVMEVLEVLAASRNETLHKQCMWLMTNESVGKTFDIRSLTKTWLEAGISNLTSIGSEKFKHLEDVYMLLEQVLSLTGVRESEELISDLENLALQYLRGLSPGDLVLKVGSTKVLEELSVALVLERHLETILYGGCQGEHVKDVLILLTSSSRVEEKYLVNTRFQVSMISAGLKFSGIDDTDDRERALLMMLPNAVFWTCIFNATGPKSKEILNHPITRKAQKMVAEIWDGLVEKSVSVYLLKKIRGNFDKFSEFFLKLISPTGEDNERIKETIKKCTNIVAKGEEDYLFLHNMLKNLEGWKLLKIEDLTLARRCFQECFENFQKGTVQADAVLTRKHWKPFDAVLKESRNISTIILSDVFWVTCEEDFQGWLPTAEDIVVEDAAVEPMEAISLYGDPIRSENPNITLKVMLKICRDGVKAYQQIWDPLFDEKDVKLSSLRMIVDPSGSIKKELERAEEVCQRKIPGWKVSALQMNKQYDKDSEKIRIIQDFHNMDCIDTTADERFDETVQAFRVLELNHDDITLKKLHNIRSKIEEIDEIVTDDILSVITEVVKSRSLLNFLKDSPMDDLKNLIDAVEEYSEQSVQESTVSALLDLKRFLSQLFLSEPKRTALQHIARLKKSLEDSHVEMLPEKISDCSTNFHGLQTLLSNVANRGEMTRDIVKNTLKQGSRFIFSFEEKDIALKLIYKSSGNQSVHTRADLCDLRSRVLLMVNTDWKSKSPLKGKDKSYEDFNTFVETVDKALEISNLLNNLHQSGHPESRSLVRGGVDIKELSNYAMEVEEVCQEWWNYLSESRQRYYWLNFFYPEQLRSIQVYLCEGTNEKTVKQLLRFTGCKVRDLRLAVQFYETLPNQDGDTHGLMKVGLSLEHTLETENHQPFVFPKKKDLQNIKILDTVQVGQIFVVHLDENARMIIPTLLALYHNTTGNFPLPYEILFCHEDTQWEDVKLFLKRCTGSVKMQTDNLFMIVSVEKLSNEVQFQLVDNLNLIEEVPVRLGVICKGSRHHSFLSHFKQNVHLVQPLTESLMEDYLKELFQDVLTVTSDLPGQGKSERIQEIAHEKDLDIRTLHISGKVNADCVIEKLAALRLTGMHLLHIDVGMLEDPDDVELLLFQIICLKNVTHLANMFNLESDHICIEIANTVDNILRNSLQTVMFFQREHIQWQEYSNFKVSYDLCSPVQVVCSYLDVFDRASIDTEDLYFTGTDSRKPLPSIHCQRILRRHFSYDSSMSFAVVEVFLNVLADQLKKLSSSHFFRTSNISGMLGELQIRDVKSQVFKALLEMSKEFATRSVSVCREKQTSDMKVMGQPQANQQFEAMTKTSASAESMIQRVDSMIQWSESNHLIVAFHNKDVNTISALYRDKSLVPSELRMLFETQIGKQMPDYSDLDQNALQKILLHVASFKKEGISEQVLVDISETYALTPDNLLKMVLIVLRVRAHVPVIIMGETGCGKTSLIFYLSKICGVKFKVQNIHAGVEEDEIKSFIFDCNKLAMENLNEFVWVFLDEINTCSHLGMINDIICHHTCQGKRLAPNLVTMAACNPYKLRNTNSISTAGLKTKITTDEQSKLVYRVKPLPESMIDYIWDYGSLSKSDEEAYIKRMVSKTVKSAKLVKCFIKLLMTSQDFIRRKEGTESCVSLRDVNRCRMLVDWFKESLKMKHSCDKKKPSHSNRIEINAIILALAHAYHSRLHNTEDRSEYRKELAAIFKTHGDPTLNDDEVNKVIQTEQKDILKRMVLPDCTAKNVALQENVFVMMVCMLNRIPVFVVGKPGCSKSLSLQLLKSNLRGQDSKDPYFQQLPQLYCVSFQGSESSTSDGIIKVFEKAERYRVSTKQSDVLPVVILDEVGLAETSKFNPLKVLHSRLEPMNGGRPNVAVIGISNWALDEAKMNRAIHLSRPDMDFDELFQTAKSISDTREAEKTTLFRITVKSYKIDEELLSAVVKAYSQYVKEQKFPNFHGLRDFYSFVKYISNKLKVKAPGGYDYDEQKTNIIMTGILRNFGGLSPDVKIVLSRFEKQELFNTKKQKYDKVPSVLDLVEENIFDKSSRHLLIVSEGQSALSLVEDLLRRMDRQSVTILGSQFEEDLKDDYSYRILSKIILCMEQGVVLILKDLDSIYGSLYDMLNQNYSQVGLKKTCRVAHGAYNNPVCHVHEDFRCIVFVEARKLDKSDPPFLNRFEKQCIKLMDILEPFEVSVMKETGDLLGRMTTHRGLRFDQSDLIPMNSSELLPSLIHFGAKKYPDISERKHLPEKCLQILLRACTPEGILRIEKSEFFMEDQNEMKKWQEYYHHLPIHKGLAAYLESMETTGDEGFESKEIIFTHSNIHTNIDKCLDLAQDQYQAEKLSSYKSEKQLSLRLQEFWSSESKKWLFIQCILSVDQENFLLMKSLIEKGVCDHHKEEELPRKKVLLIIHIERNLRNESMINFLSGWKITVVDALEPRVYSLLDILGRSKLEVAFERKESSMSQFLFWAFTLINYHKNGRDFANLKCLVEKVLAEEQILQCMEIKVLQALKKSQNDQNLENWQMEVACSRLKLCSSLTLVDALEQEIYEWMKYPFAEIVFKIESVNGWESVCNERATDQKKEVWKSLVLQESVLEMSDCSTVKRSDSFQVTDPILKLVCPFSKVFIQRIETLHELFNEVMRVEYAYTDKINQVQTREICTKMREPICEVASELFESSYGNEHFNDYFEDFIQIQYSDASTIIDEATKMQVVKWSISKRLPQETAHFNAQVVELHVINWLHGHTIHAELQLIDACLETANVDLNDILTEPITPIIQLENTHTVQQDETYRDVESETSEEQTQKGQQSELRESTVVGAEAYQFSEERQEFEEEYSGNLEEKIGMMVDEDNQSTEETKKSQQCDSPVHYWSKATAQEEEKKLEEIGTNLVSFACQKLIPTEDLMKQSSLRNWMKRVRLVLSMASQVSLDSDIYQSLSLCNEFACLLVIPCKLPETSLHNLGKLLIDHSVESEPVYQMIISILDREHAGGSGHRESLQHFFSCYLYRCLAVDPETPLLELGLKALSRMALFDSSLNYFGPTIWLILLMETDESDIFDDGLIEKSISLAYLEQCLAEFYEKGEADSEFACVLLDTLHSFILPEDLSKESKVAILHKCDLIFKSDGFSLRHVIALGALKRHLSSVAVELKTSHVEDYELQEVAGILQIDQGDEESIKNSRTRSLQEFFVKVFCQNEGLKAFEELIERLPCLEHFHFKQEDRLQALELSPMQMTSPGEYERVMESYQALPKDTGKALSVCEAARNNGTIVHCIFGVALKNLYLMKTLNLPDTERSERGKVFLTLSGKHLTPNQEKFLQCLCTFDTLKFPLLQMSENKPAIEQHMAVCVLHLISSVLAFSNMEKHRSPGQTPWEILMLDPEAIKDMYLPGGGFRIMDLHLSKFLCTNLNLRKCFLVNCLCGIRYVSTIADSNCPKCHKAPIDTNEVHYSTLRDRTRHQGYIYIGPETLNNEMITVGKMSPTSFRVLQFLLHSSLAAALAIGTVSSSQLSVILSLPEEVEVCDYLSSHLKCHWDNLSSLTEMGGGELGKIMNFLLRNGSEFISKYRVASFKKKEQEEFEHGFDSYIQTMFANRFKIVRDEVQMFHELHTTSRAANVERCIADIAEGTCRNTKLPKLMREHLSPSIKNMEREFSLQKQALVHPLMALVFERKEELMLLKHLVPLMQWHLASVQYGSHNNMAIECKSIGDFIASFHKDIDENTRNPLVKSFDNFKESWNTLRGKSEILKVYNSKVSDIPKLHLQSPVDDCLVRNNDSQVMQVITSLVNIQNRFLMDMIIISLSSENWSSSFFIQSENSVGLPCSNLDTVTSQNIVSLPDMDQMLKFSELSTKMGHGRQRQYDMYQIECQVSSDCLVNKTFLTIAPNFPMVRKPGDAFDTFENLLQDITKMVGHEQLEPTVEQLVRQIRDELFSNVQGLLDYISMTFRLLKRLPSQACNSKQTLYDFMTTWQAFVPNRMKCIETLCYRVQLSQLISLYEFVEGMLTDIVKDGLGDKYQEPLVASCEKQIEILVRKWPRNITEALLSALKKIVVRYIRYDMAEVDTPLSSLLMTMSILSEDKTTVVMGKPGLQGSGNLPVEVCVRHVCTTMDILTRGLKDAETREEKTAALSLGTRASSSKGIIDRKKEIARKLKR